MCDLYINIYFEHNYLRNVMTVDIATDLESCNVSYPPSQARAPNSPVVIVGTHLDLITKKKYPANYLPDLQRLIYDKYMDHMEPEKSGLPRVIGRIEVSCRSRLMFNSHIDELVDLIWGIVLEEPQPSESHCPCVHVHVFMSVCQRVHETLPGVYVRRRRQHFT